MGNNKKEEKLGIGGKIKRELGYMKKGARILPRVLARKTREWTAREWAAYKRRQVMLREQEEAEKAAERKAFEIERIQMAKERGQRKARQAGEASGWRGSLQELGKIGDAISLSGMLGTETRKPKQVVRQHELEELSEINPASYMFSGLEQKKKKRER